jgi:hypothetical protein
MPRDDVAAVLVALLDHPEDGVVAELLSGDTPIADAVAALPQDRLARVTTARAASSSSGG